MKKQLLSAVMLCTLGVAGCGEESTPVPVNPNTKVANSLEGKTLVMRGENLPSHPNGFNEDMNLEGSTQCYSKVTMQMGGGNYTVTSILGTLRDAPSKFNVGICDHDAPGQTVQFTSTAALIENAKEDLSCFDVTFTYNGFGQEGRGSLSADGKTLKLELYFSTQAKGHRCADGAVGAPTVTLNGQSFTGNAVQTFVVE
jgi:hypothetical protein